MLEQAAMIFGAEDSRILDAVSRAPDGVRPREETLRALAPPGLEPPGGRPGLGC